jgi:hypothetical protein
MEEPAFGNPTDCMAARPDLSDRASHDPDCSTGQIHRSTLELIIIYHSRYGLDLLSQLFYWIESFVRLIVESSDISSLGLCKILWLWIQPLVGILTL